MAQKRVPLRHLDEVGHENTFDARDEHPAHVSFVAERWIPEVAEFLELDYAPLDSHGGSMRVALFVTCIGDTLAPDAGRATMQLLERLGHDVVYPQQRTSCGQCI